MEKLPDFVYKFNVENHADIKQLLLDQIEETVQVNKIDYNSKGYLYDFPLDRNNQHNKFYIETFKKAMDPYIAKVGAEHGLRLLNFGDPWFQQYFYDSDFGWHHHGGHWAVVYFLELPEEKYQTEFLLYDNFNAKEGDVILFPTFLVHRSPSIRSESRKTIIATNITYNVDRKTINGKSRSSYRKN